eukprot:9089442-Alexandrium_andersonii.AAC.1
MAAARSSEVQRALPGGGPDLEVGLVLMQEPEAVDLPLEAILAVAAMRKAHQSGGLAVAGVRKFASC